MHPYHRRNGHTVALVQVYNLYKIKINCKRPQHFKFKRAIDGR